MKIKCNKEAIKKGFHAVESVISGTNINPMLQNVKIVAKGKTLELSTTDLEVSVSYTVGAVDVIKPGKMVGPENKIASIIKEWSEDDIEITEEDKKCVIEGKNSYFNAELMTVENAHRETMIRSTYPKAEAVVERALDSTDKKLDLKSKLGYVKLVYDKVHGETHKHVGAPTIHIDNVERLQAVIGNDLTSAQVVEGAQKDKG